MQKAAKGAKNWNSVLDLLRPRRKTAEVLDGKNSAASFELVLWYFLNAHHVTMLISTVYVQYSVEDELLKQRLSNEVTLVPNVPIVEDLNQPSLQHRLKRLRLKLSMNTQQEKQWRVIDAIFNILSVSRDIREKLIFDFGGEMVVFPPSLGPEAEIPKSLRWPAIDSLPGHLCKISSLPRALGCRKGWVRKRG